MARTKAAEKARKAEGAKLTKFVTEFVLAHGGWWKREGDPAIGMILPTTVGALNIHVVDDWIATQFQDVAAATKALGDARFGGPSAPSGKWNFGCGASDKAEGLFACWRSEIAKVLPPAAAADPRLARGAARDAIAEAVRQLTQHRSVVAAVGDRSLSNNYDTALDNVYAALRRLDWLRGGGQMHAAPLPAPTA